MSSGLVYKNPEDKHPSDAPIKPYDKVRFGKRGKVHRVRRGTDGSLMTTCNETREITPDSVTVVSDKVNCKLCLKDWNIETDDKYK